MSRGHIALLVCSNVIGGHEFQVAELAQSLTDYFAVTVFVNRQEHVKLFKDVGLEVHVAENQLLRSGTLPRQWLDGWYRRDIIRMLVEEFDHIIVSAGAVEAGASVGVALSGHRPLLMYLPFFYDRVPVWGWKGFLYNWVLASTCKLFDRIITINRIQAQIIRGFSRVRTVVVRNQIRPVGVPSSPTGKARLVFIGRLDHQKRISELISWLDFDDNPFLELLIVGDGPLRADLEAQARTCCFIRCKFLGWLSAQAQDALLNVNDILILNSLLEGEPLVVREANRRGMRVIARDIVGVRGVTRPSQRYRDAPTLRTRLIALAAPETEPEAGKTAERSNDALRRSSDIERLAMLLLGNGPQ